MENDSQHTAHVSYSYICVKADSVGEYIFVYIILIEGLEVKPDIHKPTIYSEEKTNRDSIVLLTIDIQFKTDNCIKACNYILNDYGSVEIISDVLCPQIHDRRWLNEVQSSYFPVDGTKLWLNVPKVSSSAN